MLLFWDVIGENHRLGLETGSPFLVYGSISLVGVRLCLSLQGCGSVLDRLERLLNADLLFGDSQMLRVSRGLDV